MERLKTPNWAGKATQTGSDNSLDLGESGAGDLRTDAAQSVRLREILRRQEEELSRKATKRRWTGRLLMVLGVLTMLGSCPMYAFALLPGKTIAAGLTVMCAGLALLVGGNLLSWRKPRLKDANQALLVALKHGNCLTTPRLALELDISLERADQIIQELVRKGVAEIDLGYRDPDHTIAYRIKGL